jgi:phenylpyruvate tautomerase PptA (4-oxalocrotonate tautomerase family)
MPLLQLTLGRILPDGLAQRLAGLVGEALGIPASRVMLTVTQALVHLDGIRPPAVLADLSTARTPSPEAARELARSLADTLSEALGTPTSRIYVRILAQPPSALWRIEDGAALHAGEPSAGSTSSTRDPQP